MKYIITESKLEQVVIKYLNKFYGDLEEYRIDKYSDHIFFVKDEQVHMDQDSKDGILWLKYKTIWWDLETIFGLKRPEIQKIIAKWVVETYKWRGFTPPIPEKVHHTGGKNWFYLHNI